MDPLIGKTLSHYRIEERLGSGGMGIVYRARDTQLGRDVAIKILPESVSSDPARLSRFRREAKLLAAINHPCIATIHGLQRPRRGPPFLVLELVEGESLGERLRRGALPVEEALRVCREIARALEAAHEHGVIHRDIKPGNVMLGARGVVKVLDLGLARYESPRQDPDALTSSASVVTPTEPGKVLGTPGYMSPEQVLSRPQDRRADVFGFGCVLYECLAGRRAFPGATVSERLSAAVSGEPDWGALPVGTPQQLRRLIAICLERDPERRLAAMSEASREIDDLIRSLPGPTGPERAAAGGPPHNLPEPLTSFVGREAELRGCMEMLRRHRLVTLTGAGGCGKTRLALRLAESLRSAFPDGTWLVDLAPLTDPSRVPILMASTLAITEEAGKPLLTTLAARLADKRTLLVLDNCEHMLSSCSEAARELLARCPDVVILATSREPMHLQGEQVCPVPPLSVPGPESTPHQIEASESVRLFVDRARAIAPRFHLSPEAAPAVAEICRRLDGIPLAIELAAARIKLLSPDEIRSMLGDRFRLLVGGGTSGLPRHKTLAATIEWSYGQLEPGERRLFRFLAAFTNGWGIEAATAVCGAETDRIQVLETMTHLVDKSLVLAGTSPAGESRCGYLETVRQYALERLRHEGEEEAVRERHLAYFLALGERAAAKLTGAGQAEWLSRLEADHENLLAAIEHGFGSPHQDEAVLRLTAALWRFWLGRGHFILGRKHLERALALPGGRALSRTRTEALIGAGALAFHQNDWETSRGHFDEALMISRATGNREGVGHALIGLGNLRLGQGDYATAGPLYREAMAVFTEAGHRRGAGLALSNLGRVAELSGDFDSAFPLYERGIQVFREMGDVASMALRLSSLGDLALKLGRHDASRGYLVESLRLIRDLEERRAAAYALARCATLAAEEGRSRDAGVLYGASEAIRRRIGPIMTPWESTEHESRVARAREEFGEGAFAAAWTEGEKLSFQEAIGYALACLEATRTELPRAPSGSP